MKKLRIEIQTLILATLLVLAVISSGYLFFRSLAGLVDMVQRQSEPDPALTLVRSIAAELPETEHLARLFILSKSETVLQEYQQKSDSVVRKIMELEQGGRQSALDLQIVDSVRSLVTQRLIIWNKIMDIHVSAQDESLNLVDLSRQLASTPADTLAAPAEKAGFLTRIFRKKKEEPVPVTQPGIPLQDISRQLESIRREMTESSQRLKSREAELMEDNQEAAGRMYQMIWHLESLENQRLEKNTREAAVLSATAKERVTWLGILMVSLIMILIFLLFRFLKRNSETQKMLVVAKSRAEELARSKELFIANVSHEMRTPVNAVYGITEQLLQRNMDEILKENLRIVHNSARHLLTLVNDTLDLARIHANALPLSESVFSPGQVLQESVDLVKPDADAKNLPVILETEGDLPRLLAGDPVRLKQMILNLLGNAVKFTDKGHVKVWVKSEPHEDDIRLTVRITDTGVGIPESVVPRLFEEFTQSHTNDPVKHRGSGLGLSIVKKLAEMQGGNVRLQSREGLGTEVEFYVSYKTADPDKLPDSVRDEGIRVKDQRHSEILIVDDEPFNRHLLGMILTKYGIGFREAANGREAVEMALQNDFDLIFMDIRMPLLDGVSAAKEILAKKPDSVIIALTALAGVEEEERFAAAGMKSFLPKPFTEGQLANILDQYITVYEIFENPVEPENRNSQPETGKYVDELKRIAYGNQEFFLEMIRIFIRTSNKSLGEIREAFSRQDYDTLSHLAHKLASPVKHLQADDLYRKIKKLENNRLYRMLPLDIDRLITEVEQEIEEINARFTQVLEQESGGSGKMVKTEN